MNIILYLTGPAAYKLGPMIGPSIVSGKSGASYSMTGRATVGSFHEDLRKVVCMKFGYDFID